MTLQRRQVNQQNRPANRVEAREAEGRAQQAAENRENNANEGEQINGGGGGGIANESETNVQQPQPNLFRFALTFLITFFTSMVPDRPRN